MCSCALKSWKVFVGSAHAHYGDLIMSAMASQLTGAPIVYTTVCSGADQRKHQSSASPAFVRGIPRTKGQYRGKCFHLMTSSRDDDEIPISWLRDIVRSHGNWWKNALLVRRLDDRQSFLRDLLNKRLTWRIMTRADALKCHTVRPPQTRLTLRRCHNTPHLGRQIKVMKSTFRLHVWAILIPRLVNQCWHRSPAQIYITIWRY